MTCHCAPPINPGAIVYFVLCQFKGGCAWVERDVTRTGYDATVEDIRKGDISDVVMVIETEFTPHGMDGHIHSRDVTADILKTAEELRSEDRSPIMSKFESLIASLDHARDERKNWEA